MIRERILPTTDSANSGDLPFVELFICPDYQIAYKKSSIGKFGLDENEYRYGGVYVNPTNDQQPDDLRLIYDTITFNVYEILSDIIFYLKNGSKDGTRIIFNLSLIHI